MASDSDDIFGEVGLGLGSWPMGRTLKACTLEIRIRIRDIDRQRREDADGADMKTSGGMT
jgi:hypothetical protein